MTTPSAPVTKGSGRIRNPGGHLTRHPGVTKGEHPLAVIHN